MNALIKEYYDKAQYQAMAQPDSDRYKAAAEAISFMVDQGMLPGLTYQRFVRIMYDLRKIVYV